MANTGMAQDGTGQSPTAPATNFVSKDGWLAPMKFTGTSSEDAQLWWSSFQLYKNFKELTDQRALAIFSPDVERRGNDMISRSARSNKDGLGGTPGRI